MPVARAGAGKGNARRLAGPAPYQRRTTVLRMGIEDFKDKTPEFLPEEFFDGKLEGWMVLESLTGG